MKKQKIFFGIICIGLVLILSGCTQNNNGGGNQTGNTVTMTAKQLQNDVTMEGLGTTTVSMTFNSLADGDTLILHDTLSSVSYDNATDKTEIKFNTTTPGGITSSLFLNIKGNITGTYSVGDTVNITVKIKQVTFVYNTVTYTMETFKEQYEQTDFQTSMFNPAMPQSVISKA